MVGYLETSPAWTLACVLRRQGGTAPGVVLEPALFFSEEFDLILDLAGPSALAAHGARALAQADVWTVGGAALADPALRALLEMVGCASGHRLRLLPGAIAGLDGVSATQDANVCLSVTIERPGMAAIPGPVFAGTAREGIRLYPNETNVAMAAAVAGGSLDAARLELVSSPAGGPHRMTLRAEGRLIRTASIVEVVGGGNPGEHPVAASVIAALERETRTIWAG